MASGSLPESPVGPVDQSSIEFRGVYESLTEQSFTPPQALYLLAAQITGNPGIAPGVDAPPPPQPL